MANDRVYNSKDAAGIAPKFVPNANLMARDDSGGPEWDPYTAQFGDGDMKIGAKPHLSADGSGTEDVIEGSEISDNNRTAGYKRLPDADKSRDGGVAGSAKKAKE